MPTHRAPENSNQDPSHKLAVSALQFDTGQISPAQKRFNQLLKQSETLARKIEEANQLTDAHRRVVAQTLPPLEQQHSDLVRQMVVWIDARLQRKGLTAKQNRMAREILCNLAFSLASSGDAQMRELHDAHSKVSLAEQDKAAAADMRSFMEGILGDTLGDDPTGADKLDEVLRAATQKMREQAQAHEAAKARKKANRKKTAAQTRAEAQATAQLADASAALRTIYRQLVGALHPDRETDPQEQLRKTALMKEVNTAYERRDLLALLQLQLRTELSHTDQMAHLAKEKLAALTTLLQERVKVLTRELGALQQQMAAEFGLPYGRTVSAATLQRHMNEHERELQEDIHLMQHDLKMVDDDSFFKRWLREQTEAARDDFAAFDSFPPLDGFDTFGEFPPLDDFKPSKKSRRF